MNIKNKNIDEKIYNICLLIQKICKLNLEFISNTSGSSLQLLDSQIPYQLAEARSETYLYIDKFLKDKLPGDFLCHTDNFQLSYIAVGMQEQSEYKGTIIVGPFLSDIPNEDFISNIIETNHLPLGYRMQFQQYYRSLSILDMNDNRNIGNFMINITSNPFIYGNMLFSQNKKFEINKKEKSNFKEEELYSAIELRYKVEKNLLNAVEKGAKEEALKYKKSFQFSAVHRVQNNPLRAYKNLAFSFNTLLRIASERGGVSPIYIHNLSDKFAILIEKTLSLAEIENLQINMVSEYCDLVNKFSTSGYSPIIKKAINYINLNFDSDISLSLIADNVNVNASHLSRQFKKETGVTITDYINKRRVEEAKFLIDQNNNSITEIALMVGFENHNYFCTVFKHITSLTPKEYLSNSRDKK